VHSAGNKNRVPRLEKIIAGICDKMDLQGDFKNGQNFWRVDRLPRSETKFLLLGFGNDLFLVLDFFNTLTFSRM